MNLNQIESALLDIFHAPLKDGEQRKIVFWMDKDKDFIEDIDQLTLENIKILTLSENNSFIQNIY